jgi:hypothetical protein
LRLEDEPYRYDVVGILASDAQAACSLSRGYFTEQRLAQSRWLARRF